MRLIHFFRSLLLFILLLSGVANATPSLTNNTHTASSNDTTVLTLSGSAEGYVNNSQVHITLAQESNNTELTPLVNQLNQTLNNALTLGKKYPAVTLTTGSVSYFPCYPTASKTSSTTPSQQMATIWRGSATLNIQSDNFKQVSQLLTELQQQQILIKNVSYTATSLDKQQLEQQLIPKAMQDLTQKAALIAKSLDKHIINIQKIALSQYSDSPTPFLLNTYRTTKLNTDENSQTLPLVPSKTKLSITLNANVILK